MIGTQFNYTLHVLYSIFISTKCYLLGCVDKIQCLGHTSTRKNIIAFRVKRNTAFLKNVNERKMRLMRRNVLSFVYYFFFVWDAKNHSKD